MEPVQRGFSPFLSGLLEVKEVVHTWKFNAFTNINLTRIQSNLEYEVVDSTEGVLFKGNIETPESKTIEQMIAHLKKCKVSVNSSSEVRFLCCYHSWEIGDKEASLVKGSEELMWNIFCTSLQQSSLFSISKSTIPSARCHPDTIAHIEKIKKESLNRDNIFSLINDFTISRILDKETIEKELTRLHEDKNNINNFKGFLADMTGFLSPIVVGGAWATSLAWNAVIGTSTTISSYVGGGLFGSMVGGYAGLTVGMVAFGTGSLIPLAAGAFYLLKKEEAINNQRGILDNRIKILSPQKPLFVEIEPVSVPSQIDSRIRISKFTWAVTLFAGPKGESRNHASIIIEGLANEYFEGVLSSGEYFMHKSEFNPPVRSHFYTTKKFKHDVLSGIERTEIWMISSEKVVSMLKVILFEKNLQEEKLNRGEKIPFSYQGNSSLLSDGNHNCVTWSREKLRMLNIELGVSLIGFVITIPRNYTKSMEEYQKNLAFVQI
jgi:hypothetical protein